MDSRETKELVGKLMRVNRLHRSVVHSAVGEMQLHRSGHMMLLFILNCKTPPSQKEIAEYFNITAAAVAMSLKKMEGYGLIERTPSESDSRINLISVSEKGRELIDKTKKSFEAADRAMLGDISDGELNALSLTLDKMIENLLNSGATDECIAMHKGEKR